MRSWVCGTPVLVLVLLLSGCKIVPTETAATTPVRPRPARPAASARPAGTTSPAGALPLPDLPRPAAPAGPPEGVALVAAGVEADLPAAAPDELKLMLDGRLTELRSWLAATGRRVLIIARRDNYAYYTGGADNLLAADAPPAALVVLPDRALIVAPTDLLDAARAQVRGLGFQGLRFRWDLAHEPGSLVAAVRAVAGERDLAADVHLPGTELVADDLLARRQQLSALEQQRLAWLASQTGEAVATALGGVQVQHTEAELARRLTVTLSERGLAICDLRVTALARLERDGLGLAGETKLDGGAAVHVTATRWGLRATVGRTVTPVARPEATEAYAAARVVYRGLLSAVVPGTALRDIHQAAVKAAEGAGVPNLFDLQAPGGVGAYEVAGRPFTPTATARLEARQVATLTVRLPRAYLADTVLVRSDKVILLTVTPGWPSPAAELNNQLVPLPTLRGAELAVLAAEQQRQETKAQARAVRFVHDLVGGAIGEAMANAKKAPKRPADQPPAATDDEPAHRKEPGRKPAPGKERGKAPEGGGATTPS